MADRFCSPFLVHRWEFRITPKALISIISARPWKLQAITTFLSVLFISQICARGFLCNPSYQSCSPNRSTWTEASDSSRSLIRREGTGVFESSSIFQSGCFKAVHHMGSSSMALPKRVLFCKDTSFIAAERIQHHSSKHWRVFKELLRLGSLGLVCGDPLHSLYASRWGRLSFSARRCIPSFAAVDGAPPLWLYCCIPSLQSCAQVS